MPRFRVWQLLYMMLVVALLVGLVPVQAQAPVAETSASAALPAQNALAATSSKTAPAPASFDKILVDSQDSQTLNELAASGAKLVEDYGTFSLWKVAAGQGKTLATSKPNSVSFQGDLDLIQLRNGNIDTTRGATPVPASLQQVKTAAPQFWLVQFVGPIKSDWLAELAKQGIQVVSYIPSNAYVVWADGAAVDSLQKQVSSGGSAVQWAGAYQPAYRLATELQPDSLKAATDGLVDVTVQFYVTKDVNTSVKNLLALGGKVNVRPFQIQNYMDVSLQLPASKLVEVANWPDVFNIERWVAPQLRDERQDQIMAGNVTTTISGTVVPTGPGYLAWLASKGFSTNPADYPLVDVMDDGIDNGTTTPIHPDFYVLGDKTKPDRLVYNENCTTDPLPNAVGGHGNLNAGIVGGYNNTAGVPYRDAGGYQLGQGVNPYARLGGTKIFRNSGSFDLSNCGGDPVGVIGTSYAAGAKITSNSWGADVAGAYDSFSQAYDALTRDGSASTPGNQQMLHVFAAGNAGSGAGTVGSPGSAKNIITVGATENVRDDGIADGCSVTAGANADNIAFFSSRGPTKDTRIKPDVVAPGMHIQGPASQDPGFDGSGVCGGAANKYYPNFAQNGITQTLYTWSSGTSHSTPAVSGAASLVYNYYQRVLSPGQNPTPAMIKGLLINGSRYMKGTAANDTLPSNNQGWGDVALNNIFDSSTHYCVLVNQSVVLTATGQIYSKACQVADPNKPVRVTLAWTDAPGSTTGNAYVNDLNLLVSFSGASYKGNVFSGGNSVQGGAYDPRNNVENVFLPAGASGPMLVKVTAANLAADAINGGANPQQDFALIVANADPLTAGTVLLSAAGTTFNDLPPGGNGNGSIEPGESIKLSQQVANNGNVAATGVTATLTTTSPFVTITTGTVSYPDIAPNATAGSTTPFSFDVSPATPCGQVLTFTITTYYTGGSFSNTFSYQAGQPSVGAPTNYVSANVPIAIPDNNPVGITSTLPVAAPGTVGKITVTINVSHTFDSDLVIKLVSPKGTVVTLVNRRGSSGDNFTNTVFDDNAPTPISSGSAPFASSYRPETPLSAVADEPINGTWKLQAADLANADVGTLNAWSINIAPRVYLCAAPTPQPAASLQVGGYPSPVTVSSSHTFTVTAKDSQGNVAVAYTGTVAFSSNAPTVVLPANYTFQPGDFGTHVFNASFGVTGTYAITATDVANASVKGSQGGIVVQGAPATITATAGITQAASLNNSFASSLQAVVRDSGGTPLGGVAVVFAAPASGASATFSNGSNTITVTTNAGGLANSGPVTANGTPGTYQVTASVAGTAIPPAVYSLTNVATSCSAYVVTANTDDGTALNCGTLSYAIASANSALRLNSSTVVTITFSLGSSKVISVTGGLPPVRAGITIDGGACASGPSVTLDGTGYNGDGLTLTGGNVYSLRITHFGGRQLVINSGSSRVRCVVATR